MIFLDKFNNAKNIRFPMFYKALLYAKDRNHKVFVETGTSRGKVKFFFFKKYNWKDGMSTPILSSFTKNFSGELHSCDLSIKNIKIAKFFTKKINPNVKFYIDDSLNFLKNFPKKIDFLYLDSLDGHDPITASHHQLKEVKISLNKLHEKSLILLDDKGSKTNFSIEFLIKNSFKILHETDYQVLLSK